MGNKKYYWLKLQSDFFDSKRIKKLRGMAGGDTYVIIYLKMQLLAMQSDGVLTWTGLEDRVADELALDLDEKADDVEVTLMYLLKTGLAETSDNINFFFPYAVENTASEGASAQRVREFRQRQALLCNASETPVKQNGNVEKEKDIEIENRDSIVSKDTICSTDVQLVIDSWNSLGLTKVTKVLPDSQRGQWLSKRIRDYGVDNVLKAIENVRHSRFLMGDNRKGWQITFDWFVRPNNFPKVLDGNYGETESKKTDNIFLQMLQEA